MCQWFDSTHHHKDSVVYYYMKGKTAVTTKYANVLLVDDNEIDNFINERMITSTNFSSKVTVKDSADDALSFLREHVEDLENLTSDNLSGS